MLLNICGKIATKKWEQLDQRFPEIEIDEFIIMPDHMHGIVIISDVVRANPVVANSIGENDAVWAIHELPIHELPRQQDEIETNSPIARRRMTLPMVIGFYKMNTAKAINIANDTRGTPVWQRNYYEHIIRNQDSLVHIRRYIQENPIKWPVDPENRNCASR
jgi:REP element-mobilizing transposase RayT